MTKRNSYLEYAREEKGFVAEPIIVDYLLLENSHNYSRESHVSYRSLVLVSQVR